MAGSFVSTWRVKPPSGRTLMVRDGASVFDAFHCRWRGRWFMLLPGGGEEKIEEPMFWYCRDCDLQSLSAESKKELSKKPIEMPVINRRGQMMLNLGSVA